MLMTMLDVPFIPEIAKAVVFILVVNEFGARLIREQPKTTRKKRAE